MSYILQIVFTNFVNIQAAADAESRREVSEWEEREKSIHYLVISDKILLAVLNLSVLNADTESIIHISPPSLF